MLLQEERFVVLFLKPSVTRMCSVELTALLHLGGTKEEGGDRRLFQKGNRRFHLGQTGCFSSLILGFFFAPPQKRDMMLEKRYGCLKVVPDCLLKSTTEMKSIIFISQCHSW